jgi:hypothetical protein
VILHIEELYRNMKLLRLRRKEYDDDADEEEESNE